jgi:hypothetical protein
MENLDKLLKADPTTATIACVALGFRIQVAGDNNRALAVERLSFGLGGCPRGPTDSGGETGQKMG